MVHLHLSLSLYRGKIVKLPLRPRIRYSTPVVKVYIIGFESLPMCVRQRQLGLFDLSQKNHWHGGTLFGTCLSRRSAETNSSVTTANSCGLKLLHFAEPILHCGTVGTQLQRCHSAARGSNLLENAAEWHRCSCLEVLCQENWDHSYVVFVCIDRPR